MNDSSIPEGYRIRLADNASMTGSTYHRFSASDGTVTGLSAAKTYYAQVRVITPDVGGGP